VVVPQDSGDGRAVRAARERLGQLLESLRSDKIVAAGMIGDPDPYTAAMNALQYFHISEVVISTLPSNRSAWVEKGLIEKIERESGKPVQHVEAKEEPSRGQGLMEAASVAGTHGSHAGVHDEEHHGPPEANRSSRVEPQLLGMLLFIISEVMVFGAFFTAYFFIRVVNGDEWPAAGTELPKLIAGVNTAILLSSSFTMHWALECAKSGNRFGLKAGSSPRSGSARPSSSSRSTSTSTSASRPPTPPRARSSTGSRACTARTCSSADAALDGHHPHLQGAFHPRGAPRRRGAGHLLALRRRHVGDRLPERLHHLVLNPLRSEAEAFRFLIYVVVVAVLIAGFVLLVRALF
jgi:hypothetical protein